MRDLIREALMRKVEVKHGKRKTVVALEPNPRLVLGVKFAIAMTVCLTILEVAHMALLGKWNSEVFAAITGLTGTVTGIFISQKA